MTGLKRAAMAAAVFACTLGIGACDEESNDSADAALDTSDAGFSDTPDSGENDSDADTADAPDLPPSSPAADNISDDILRFMGQAELEWSEVSDGRGRYRFDVDSGPACLRGGTFSMGTRDGTENSLMVFLQGGGACWSELCIASSTSDPTIPDIVFELIHAEEEFSPVANWNLVYLPYCDGSLFAGDVEVDLDNDGEPDRIQHGLQNFSAAMDIALERYPNPERIMVSGSSAGGFGTVLATSFLRKLFPHQPIYVFNDAGVGVAKGEADLQFVDRMFDEWNAREFVPESCDDCFENGHLTPLMAWQLENDPNLKIATYSSMQDSVISGTFLRLDPELFETMLRRESQRLHALFPARFNAALQAGDSHTTAFSINNNRINGTSIRDWLELMLDDDPAWDMLIDETAD